MSTASGNFFRFFSGRSVVENPPRRIKKERQRKNAPLHKKNILNQMGYTFM